MRVVKNSLFTSDHASSSIDPQPSDDQEDEEI